ncbi:MAG: exodeoxyribonuclease VII large subunit [Bacteroidaceae bacterium]|nr:exodeoxyribonuclease VII large subunit [Bacteroidaceae bacterium]
MQEEVLTLYELNNMVRSVLEGTLRDSYWVQAELSEVNPNRNGHCYVEFVQKAKRGNQFVAKARGNIWANVYAFLAPFFEQATGQRFAAGLKVLVNVQVTFHEVYGLSLNVLDIDPTYTLGDMARKRKEILDQLEAEGVLNMNKEVPMPVLPQRVAVISAPTAAGYGDFCNQLKNNPQGYVFYPKLFPAVMQGAQTESSIIQALDAVAAEMDHFDVVVIIRGGGAVADLASFDTYPLAVNVAQFPLPIITGIGHERDDTVLDLVANTRVKTPTAAAEFLIGRLDETSSELEELAQVLVSCVQQQLSDERMRLQQLAAGLSVAYARRRADEELMLDRFAHRMAAAAAGGVERRKHEIQLLEQRIGFQVPLRVEKEKSRLQLLSQRIEDNSPERLLARGYSITLKNGKAVTKASQVEKGDLLVTRLSDGNVESKVL